MRWYVEPFAAEQRRFNAAVLRLADALSERVDARSDAQSQEGLASCVSPARNAGRSSSRSG